jgi:DNA-binding protein H-NS
MITLQELIAQRDAIDKQIAEVSQKARSEAIKAAFALIAEHGLTRQELFGGTAGNVKKAKSASKVKVAAKYRDPATGKEWSGRGIPPKWITTSGKDKVDFLITK